MTKTTMRIIIAGACVALYGFVVLAPLLGWSLVLCVALGLFTAHLRWIANRCDGGGGWPTRSQ